MGCVPSISAVLLQVREVVLAHLLVDFVAGIRRDLELVVNVNVNSHLEKLSFSILALPLRMKRNSCQESPGVTIFIRK